MIRSEIQQQFSTLYTSIKPALPEDESGQNLAQIFEQTLTALEGDAEYLFLAEDALTRLITFYPHLTPVIPRELLWSIGGSCLSFLEDDEIDRFSEQNDQDSTQH